MRVDHLAYASDFKLLSRRVELLKREHVDPQIAQFITMANLSPELVTVFSCQGHNRKPRWDEGYVMFAVRDRRHIQALYECVRAAFGNNQHLVGLTMTTRANFLKPRNPITGEHPWMAVWILYWRRSSEVNRYQGWKNLERGGIKFLEWVREQNESKNKG